MGHFDIFNGFPIITGFPYVLIHIVSARNSKFIPMSVLLLKMP